MKSSTIIIIIFILIVIISFSAILISNYILSPDYIRRQKIQRKIRNRR